MTLTKMRIQMGLWTYLIPFVLCWAIFRLFSWIVEPNHSMENSLYAYGIYLVLIIVNMVTAFWLAELGLSKAWWVKFLFAISSLILFAPVLLILAPLGALIIYIASLKRLIILWIIACVLNATIFFSVYLYKRYGGDLSVFFFILGPIQVFTFWICSFKKEHIGCVITSFLAPIAMFSLGLFVSQHGNIRDFRNAKKGVLIFNHKGSADYFISAFVNMYKNWRIMIGENLWSWRLLHWFFNAVGVPIPRESGLNIKRNKSIEASKDFISFNDEAIITIFPEGTRNRKKEPLLLFYNGAFKIACDTGTPVFPVVIINAEIWRKPREQVIESYRRKKGISLISFLRKIKKLLVIIFKEGINPTIIRIYYLDPIETVGKTYKEVKDKAWKAMYDAYVKYKK